MEPTYILKELRMNLKKNEVVIREGDIILDKFYGLEVLPARFDFVKPITRKKASNDPEKTSERLLRIKELGEDRAMVAILHQEVHYEGTDTLVTVEEEQLRTVKYGEEFSVYAKEQVYDSPGAVTFDFIIVDKSKQQEQKAPNFCTECGEKLIKGDRFCRECGTPVFK